MIQGITTAALLIAFAGGCLWLWGIRRGKDFESAARLPLDEDTKE